MKSLLTPQPCLHAPCIIIHQRQLELIVSMSRVLQAAVHTKEERVPMDAVAAEICTYIVYASKRNGAGCDPSYS